MQVVNFVSYSRSSSLWAVKAVLTGIAGHAAAPHATRDPDTAAAHLIIALNAIVARSVDPLDTAALTCSMIYGDSVSNHIPESMTLIGTLRTFDSEVRRTIITRNKRDRSSSRSAQNHWPGSIRPKSINCCECQSNGMELCHRKSVMSKREPALLFNALAVRKEAIAVVML